MAYSGDTEPPWWGRHCQSVTHTCILTLCCRITHLLKTFYCLALREIFLEQNQNMEEAYFVHLSREDFYLFFFFYDADDLPHTCKTVL